MQRDHVNVSHVCRLNDIEYTSAELTVSRCWNPALTDDKITLRRLLGGNELHCYVGEISSEDQ